MIPKEIRYPLEWIEWYDAASDDSWCSVQELKKYATERMVITEVGFVVYEDKEVIVISNQITCDWSIGNRTRVPKGWIKSRKKIRCANGH